MNANCKLIRNAKSLAYSIFGTKSNERRRWWTDNDGTSRITHRAKRRREYETWISPEADEDVSFLYGEAPYLTLLSSMTIPISVLESESGPHLWVDVVLVYRFGASSRKRTEVLNCTWYENGGDGHGVLLVRSVTPYS